MSKAEGSIVDIKERSRSRSRRAKYEKQKREGELQRSESMASIMRSSRKSSPNQLSLK